jgi:hypothetical protein
MELHPKMIRITGIITDLLRSSRNTNTKTNCVTMSTGKSNPKNANGQKLAGLTNWLRKQAIKGIAVSR